MLLLWEVLNRILKFELFTFDAALAAENILSTIPDSLILADTDKRMLRVNERLLNFIGCSQEELKYQPIITLCAENEEKNLENVLNELAEKGIIRNHELMLVTKSGDKKQVLFSGSTVRSKTGRTIGLAIVIHDITEHKNMEEKLVKAERLASIGELAGQIGHDLRNPLAGIKNCAYIMKKKSDRMTEKEREQILATIDNAVEDADRIVTTIIDYSSELNLDHQECTPKSLVMHALSKIKVPERINIVNNASEDFTLFLDAPRIEKTFVNIIKNAIDAISEKIVIKISTALKGPNLETSFTDSGTGIPQSILPRIFSPLVTTKAKGMGMNLAICKRIVEAHGGKITVETAIGQGTTFTVILPIKRSKNEFATSVDFCVDLNHTFSLVSTK